MKTRDNKKAKYGFLSCIKYSVAMTWSTEKSVAVSAIGVIPVALILNAIGLYMPSIILNKLETADAFTDIILIIIALLSAQMFFMLICQYIEIKRSDAEYYVMTKLDYDRNVRARDMDYYLRMEEANVKIFERASATTRDNHTAGIHFVEYFAYIVIDILSFILFGSMVAILNPFIVILLAAGCFALPIILTG